MEVTDFEILLIDDMCYLYFLWKLVFKVLIRELKKSNITVTGGCPFQHGDRLYASESHVCRRQILTSKVDHRIEGLHIFIMAVDLLKWSGKT